MVGSPAGAFLQDVESMLRQDPLVAAAVALVVVGVVVLAVGVVRWLRRPEGVRLRRALAKPESVAVLMHPNPDPDAMAAALGVRELAASVDTPATIQYAGQIRHQENRAFRTVLDLAFDRVAKAGELAGEEVVLVDHNEPRGFDGADSVDPYAVVDHHPGSGEGTAFTDVRPEYGACASILAEYFQSVGAEPVEEADADDDEDDYDDDALPADVATGLLYGILADTAHLTRGCTSAEFEASAYLYPGVDEDALDRIANPQVDAEVLEIKARAITDRDVRNSFAVCDVGTVSNVDAIPQAADELLHLEGVTAVVVFGDKDETIHLSGRSRDDRVHMGNALETAVREIPMASAGGHARMGGGQLSVAHMEGIGPSDGVSREEFADHLFDAMVGDV